MVTGLVGIEAGAEVAAGIDTAAGGTAHPLEEVVIALTTAAIRHADRYPTRCCKPQLCEQASCSHPEQPCIATPGRA